MELRDKIENFYRTSNSVQKLIIINIILFIVPFFFETFTYLFTLENVAKLFINPIFGPSGVSIGHILP